MKRISALLLHDLSQSFGRGVAALFALAMLQFVISEFQIQIFLAAMPLAAFLFISNIESTEQRSGGERFLLTLPYTVNDIVVCRHIFAVICALFTALGYLTMGHLVGLIVTLKGAVMLNAQLIMLGSLFFSVTAALLLTFFLGAGYKRASLVTKVAVLAIMMLTLTPDVLQWLMRAFAVIPSQARLPAALALDVLLLAGSALLSKRGMKRRLQS